MEPLIPFPTTSRAWLDNYVEAFATLSSAEDLRHAGELLIEEIFARRELCFGVLSKMRPSQFAEVEKAFFAAGSSEVLIDMDQVRIRSVEDRPADAR